MLVNGQRSQGIKKQGNNERAKARIQTREVYIPNLLYYSNETYINRLTLNKLDLVR